MSQRVQVAVVADPGLAADVVTGIADGLVDRLRAEVDDEVDWQVEVVSDRFAADARGTVRDAEAVVRGRLGDEDAGDLWVCLTDLPRRDRGAAVVGETDQDSRIGVASLPALGAHDLAARVSAALTTLVAELRGAEAPPLPSTRRVEDPARAGVKYLSRGPRGRLRLVAGMVRANRPWRLALDLTGVLVAAVGTGSYCLLIATVWQLGSRLSPLRLAVATALSVVGLVGWLILSHRLWERPSERVHPQQARLYNAVTVLTLAFGVLTLYSALFLLVFSAELLVLNPSVFQAQVGHPPSTGDRVGVAWFASSVATVAGALGSKLESDESVRAAAYGNRQRGHPEPGTESG
ncbi:hypothetical protein [Actinokineospora bangkokensis]|uniref:DUF2267 domain-containing protein n=1 Tax=Actinokineospora bangkokensis TaxID=1193682 RepID=A0A1Q9LLS9_9PSEU|nr:hypothetical protein [Actinokineospora bangkokensis]OLR92959.1 hypothetical protein BJP25_18490 [Actinokineospora bangkokensis]